jgi:DNA-binding CsgD family transcriptional regulator
VPVAGGAARGLALGGCMPEVELPGGLGERRALELVHGVLRALSWAETTDEALHAVVGRGLQWLQPVGAVLGRQFDGIVAIDHWGTSLDLRPDSFDNGSLAHNPWSDAIRLCEPIWLSSIEDRKAQYPELRVDDDVESLAVLPLVARGAALGVLGVAFAPPSRFDETLRAFLIALTDVCSLWLLHPARSRDDARRGYASNGTEMPTGPAGHTAAHESSHSNRDGFVQLLAAEVRLTAREREIATALTRGLRSAAIARDLGISIYTVRKHISAILRKYDVTSQGELIARIFAQSSRDGSGVGLGDRTAV